MTLLFLGLLIGFCIGLVVGIYLTVACAMDGRIRA